MAHAIVPSKDEDEESYDQENDWEWTGNAHITKFDSLTYRSFQPKKGAAMFKPQLSKQESTQLENDRKIFRELIKKFDAVKDICENFGYNKHVRAVYFNIDFIVGAPKKTMDVIFVPEMDIANCGGLINWMKYNFDLQICANAISAESAYCYAPKEIANGKGYIRLDQYCCGVTITDPPPTPSEDSIKSPRRQRFRVEEHGIEAIEDQRWESQFDEDYGTCNCPEIVVQRILKYRERGFQIVAGTFDEYEKWRIENN